MTISVEKEDIGTKKQGKCPQCQSSMLIPIPTSLASKFVSDPTFVGGDGGGKILYLESVANDNTPYQSFELSSDIYSVGRKNNGGPATRPDIEINTTDMKISRKHVIIQKKANGDFVLKDNGSKNGVCLNGVKLEGGDEMYLNDGDTFRLGDTSFRVFITEKN